MSHNSCRNSFCILFVRLVLDSNQNYWYRAFKPLERHFAWQSLLCPSLLLFIFSISGSILLWGANEVWRRVRDTTWESRENDSICYDNHISMMDHVPQVLAGKVEQGAGPVSCLGRCIWEPLLLVPRGVCRGSAALRNPKPNAKPLAQRMCQHRNSPGTLVLHTEYPAN